MFFKAHTIHVAPIYKPHIVCRNVFWPDAAMPASIREGVECALDLMQRLFGLVVDTGKKARESYK